MSVSCSIQEDDTTEHFTGQEFYARMEQPSDIATKVHVDDMLRVLWDADDRVSIFDKDTYNREYRFKGSTGDDSGVFGIVLSDGTATEQSLDHIYAVYPYRENNKINDDGMLSVFLTGRQSYRKGSFGPEANTMVSCTDNGLLVFKNLCGYLALKLYGDNVSVSSVTFRGNDGEPIAGEASVNSSPDLSPILSFKNTATTDITLDMEKTVLLGSSESDAETFWLVIPPVTFSKGFTIIVTCQDGARFEKSTSQQFVIERNTLSRMAALKVEPEGQEEEIVDYIDEYGVNYGPGTTIDGITWAPVNCGFKPATSESKGYPYGKLYQWGRKYGQGYGQPYYSSSDKYEDESVPKLASQWNGSNESADPDTFYYGVLYQSAYGEYNWISSNEGFWNKGSESDPIKNELYDPCPKGWRVPTSSELSTLSSGGHSDLLMVNGIYGAWYSGSAAFNESLEGKIFLPASGGRFADNWFHQNGAVGRGSGGNYWASSSQNGFGMNMDFLGNTNISSSYKAFGFAVRCCKDGDFIPVPVSEISLDQTSITLEEGRSVTLKATVKPDDASGKTITWASSDTSVATVSDGTIIAVSAGSATITATAGGKTAACAVTVIKGEEAKISVSPEVISLPPEGGAAEVTVEANMEVSYKVQDGANWLSVTKDPKTKGMERTSFTIKATENISGQRDAVIIFSGRGVEKSVAVSQTGYPIVLSATSINADCLDGVTVSVQVEAQSAWTVKETGSSFLTISKESGKAGTETVTMTILGSNCTNSERVANVVFTCDSSSKYLEIKQLPAFHFDSLDQIVPSTGGSYSFSFNYAKTSTSRSIRYEGDEGFRKLMNEAAYDDGLSISTAYNASANNAAPTMETFHTSMDYKPNFRKDSRSGRFRLFFDEDDQRLYSEWINVTQLPDEISGDELDGVPTVLRQHTVGNGVPVVILGDGFTRTDIIDGSFAQAANKAYEYFFTAEPLTSLQDYFDVWSVTAISSSSTFNGSGTRFGSRNTSGTTIVGNNDLAYHYASKVVPQDKLNDMLVIVVMNTDIYAGTCHSFYIDYYYTGKRELTHSIAYVPMCKRNGVTFEDLIHHEACGHGMGKLADEYSGQSAIPSNVRDELLKSQSAGGYLNVDVNSYVSETSWAQFAADSRFSYENIGAYEGAYTYRSGVYRPTQNSMMNNDYRMFNAPSRAQIYRRVMGVANDWNWEFDYETFVSFDAPFRKAHYSTANTIEPEPDNRNDILPLAPPVMVRIDEDYYSSY